MKLKFFAAAVLAAFALQFSIPANADGTANRRHKVQTNQLVAMLPASDGVVTMHAGRFMNDALPKLLSANQPMMADVLGKIEAIQEKTGIDLRSFEYIAAGIKVKTVSEKEYDFEPVVIARGEVNTDQLISAAKSAAKGKYREERFDGKVIYIFPAKDIAEVNISDDQKAKAGKWFGRFTNGMMGEVAVSVLSSNTIAFGKPERVREAIEGKTRVGTDIVELLNRKEIAVMNMAAKAPAGMSQFLPLDDDELGRSIDSIKYIFGNLDVVGDEAVMNMTARTQKNADAQTLFETIDGLKAVGGMLLGGSKRPDQQLYARLISNAKLSRSGADVSLDLRVPQDDIDALLAVLGK